MFIGWRASRPSLSPFYAVLRRVPLLYGVSRRAVFASLSWLVLLGGKPLALFAFGEVGVFYGVSRRAVFGFTLLASHYWVASLSPWVGWFCWVARRGFRDAGCFWRASSKKLKIERWYAFGVLLAGWFCWVASLSPQKIFVKMIILCIFVC